MTKAGELRASALRASELRSGKGANDENFPVASRLIHPRHRAAVLAFYEFVRVADDIADHASLTEPEKLAFLDRLESDLLGTTSEHAEAVRLREELDRRDLTPQHAQDLLKAFRMDVTKTRYHDWDDLIDYCSYSAMPVGRFVLDVHGESTDCWRANDALCAALQIINHLQDCGKDYRDLDRVYIPLDALAAAGADVAALGEPQATLALRACITGLAERTETLLREAQIFSALIADRRLGLEVSVIHTLARRLVHLLRTRDPLSERVHLRKPEILALTLYGIGAGWVRRLGSNPSLPAAGRAS
ncbi:MAG: squalene synthase HpnC [Pseudorhodoplanes sp.]